VRVGQGHHESRCSPCPNLTHPLRVGVGPALPGRLCAAFKTVVHGLLHRAPSSSYLGDLRGHSLVIALDPPTLQTPDPGALDLRPQEVDDNGQQGTVYHFTVPFLTPHSCVSCFHDVI
jgi:hypothetical protein